MFLRRRALLPVWLIAFAACSSGQPAPRSRSPNPQQAGQTPPASVVPPSLPDSAGFGTHVLVIARPSPVETWVGTFGKGIYVMRRGAKQWEHIASLKDSANAISWNFVNSIAFQRDSSVWYGTIGNGFGRSADHGKTWKNWTVTQLGPAWQYVTPEGIRTRNDTVYIATADGLRITSDAGNTWRCVQSPAESNSAAKDGCTERLTGLPNKYILAMDIGPDGSIWVGHLSGLSVSRDVGRTWKTVTDSDNQLKGRVRAISVAAARRLDPSLQAPGMIAAAPGMGGGGMGGGMGAGGMDPNSQMQRRQQSGRRREAPEAVDSSVYVATEHGLFKGHFVREEFKPFTVDVPGMYGAMGGTRAIIIPPYSRNPALLTSRGFVAVESDSLYHLFLGSGELYRPAADMWSGVWIFGRLLPIVGSSTGIDRVLPIQKRVWDLIAPQAAPPPTDSKHTWFRRPINDAEGNPYVDGTYRYGSTMGGNFQQHQGVEFNNPAGTPVHAVEAGVVIFAGPAEAGANTVAIRHDRKWENQNVYTVYYHNSSLTVRAGQRVNAGDLIARVGSTGRATNEHLHLEVHVTESTDSSKIVHADVRFPQFTVNPQLWIEPIPGTGTVAGQVLGADGKAIPGARVYGLVQTYPEETPFSFAETYSDKAHPDPAYGEHFAVGDVPEGRYLLGVEIGGTFVWRTVQVVAGKVTWVQFKP